MDAKVLLFLILLLLPVLLSPAIAPTTAATQPTLLIQKTWGGTGGDSGRSVAVDSLGSIYVAGTTGSFGAGSYDALLLKYDSTGFLLWQRTWGGSDVDSGRGVTVDASGGVYVTGITESYGAGGEDVFLLKFNSTGDLLWQRTWGNSGTNQANAVAADASGGIYVTGNTANLGDSYSHVFLLKFDSSGGLLWQMIWEGSQGEEGWDVAVDSSSNLYVTGATSSFGAGNVDVFLLKFDSIGTLLWQKTWGGTSWDEGYGVAVDSSSNNVYVTGETGSFGAGGSQDAFLLKFDSSGSLLWQKTWGGTGSDSGRAVNVDGSGNIYLTGTTGSFDAYSGDVFLLKFSSTGSLTWQIMWGCDGADVGRDVVADSSGNAVVTGTTDLFGTPGSTPTYTMGAFGNNTLGNPAFTLGTPNGSLSNPDFTLSTPSGALGTPTGSETYAGNGDPFLLIYNGVLPTGTVTFHTNPTEGGSISFNGTAYTDGQAGSYSYAVASVWAYPPAGYHFAGWNATGGVVVVHPSVNVTKVKIAGPGTLTANFVNTSSLAFYTNPDAAGSISFNGTILTNSQTSEYPNGNFTANAIPTLGYIFNHWLAAGGVTINSDMQNPTTGRVTGSGTLTVFFNANLTFGTTPATAGNLRFNGTLYTNGMNGYYPLGTATVTATALSGYTFTSWTSSGGIAVANVHGSSTTATISGPGTLTANFGPVVCCGPPNVTTLTPGTLLLTTLLVSSVLLLQRRRPRNRDS